MLLGRKSWLLVTSATITFLLPIISFPVSDVAAECKMHSQQPAIAVTTDREYYSLYQEIVIGGTVKSEVITNNDKVLIQIYAPNGTLIKSDNATLKIADGTFTLKLILEGNSDLELDGRYKVTALYNSHVANWSFVLTSGIVEIQAVEIGVPIIREVNGNTITNNEVHTGQQVVLSTVIRNIQESRDQPFAAISEVRDSTGVTVYLAIQSSVLRPDCSTEFGFSWVAEKEEQYEVRTFVITSLADPQILSMVTVREITTTH